MNGQSLIGTVHFLNKEKKTPGILPILETGYEKFGIKIWQNGKTMLLLRRKVGGVVDRGGLENR